MIFQEVLKTIFNFRCFYYRLHSRKEGFWYRESVNFKLAVLILSHCGGIIRLGDEIMSILKIYHGSNHIVGTPVFGAGKTYNDYGQGFYCTESVELAKEWACSEKGVDGFANAYKLNTNGLKILNLSSSDYNILNWLAILLNNRKVNVSLPVAARAKEYIIENFNVNTDDYDIIIGYRADDSYFSFARDFVNNGISAEQLSRAMRLGKLGEQIVLKSKRAFEALLFLQDQTEFADSSIYFPKREKRNNDAQNEYLTGERNTLDDDGLFVRDIIRRGINNDNFNSFL